MFDAIFRADDVEFRGNFVGQGRGGAVAVLPGGEFTSVGGSYANNRVGLGNNDPDARGGAVAVADGAEALIIGAGFDGNVAFDGGAILNEGTLGLRDTTFTRNAAIGESSSGGAIFAAAGTFYGENVVAIGNTANRAGGAVEVGEGTFALRAFALNGNSAGGDDFDGFDASPGNGGALHVTGAATVYLVNGDVRENFAAAEGGGLWNQEGAVMSVQGVTFVGNVADGDAADQGGGAIYNNGGTLRVDQSILFRNRAIGVSGSGGGLLTTGGVVRVVGSTFNENAANRAGGAIETVDTELVIEDASRLIRNVAGPGGTARPGNGGGLHAAGDGDVVIRNSRVSNNTARAEGGGLWNGADSVMTLENVPLSGNVARGANADQGGGGLYNAGGRVFISDGFVGDNDATGDAGSGGGVFSTDGRVEIRDTNLARNTAVRAGGAIEIVDGDLRVFESKMVANFAGPAGRGDDGPGNGGAVHVSGTLATVAITGGAIARNDAAGEGGGLWNQSGSRMALRDVRVRNNAATGGGGIYNNGGDLFLRGRTRVDRNVADSNGGGISNVNGGFVRVQDSAVRNNVAGFGGGMFVGRFSDAILRDAVFRGNVPGDFAGPGFVGGDTDGLEEG